MRYKSGILKLALFATGLAGIVAEYTLSTLATYFLGDSVLQFTMIVSIMLFSMGLGSRLSKLINDDLMIAFISIEFILSIICSFASIITYLFSAFIPDLVGFIIYFMSIVIGLLIGMEIPLVIRLNEKFEELKVNISSVMEKDYYGSLLGGVFFAFVGLPYLGLTYTPFVLGSVNFIVALALTYVVWQSFGQAKRVKIVFGGMAIAVSLLGGLIFAKDIVEYGESRRYKDPLVYSEQSAYQRIVMTASDEGFWLFINGNQQLSSVDEVMYHEPLVHPVMGLIDQPKSILIMGGGDGCAIREVLKYPSVEEIILVDLDPAMTDLGKENPLLRNLNQSAFFSDRLEVVNDDGFAYLEKMRRKFDAIIIDLPDPKSVELSRLYSREFYRLCYSRLEEHGVMITQAGSPYYAERAFKCIEATVSHAGFTSVPLHNQVVTLGEWGWILGAKNISRKDLINDIKNISLKNINTKWLNEDGLKMICSFGKTVFEGVESKVEINAIHNPVLPRYYEAGFWDVY